MCSWSALLVSAVLLTLSGAGRAGVASSSDAPFPLLALQGELRQGGIVRGSVCPGTSVTLGEIKVPVTQAGWFVLGFGRDASSAQSLALVPGDDDAGRCGGGDQKLARGKVDWRPDGTVLVEWKLDTVVYDVQYVEGISQQIMQPDAAALERIKKENQLVGRARAERTDSFGFAESFIWPAAGPVSGVYGSQRVYNGVPGRPHFGLDIAGPAGATVIAPASGKVVLAHPDMFYSGGTVIVDHGAGLSSSFLHMSALLVAEGEQVKRGQPLGRIGSSGRATGPHLDWRMNWLTARVDPRQLVSDKPRPETEKSLLEQIRLQNDLTDQSAARVPGFLLPAASLETE